MRARGVKQGLELSRKRLAELVETLRKPNPYPRSANIKSVRGLYILSTFFILIFVTSPSEANEIIKERWLSQFAGEQTTSTKLSIQFPFQTIAKGYRSGVRESLQLVARNQAEWDVLWKRHVSIETNPVPLPPINFDKQIVVGVFLGEKPTGGYEVEIIRAEQSDGALVLHYREKSPLPGSIVTQALTQPFHIIQLVKDDSLTPTFRRAS